MSSATLPLRSVSRYQCSKRMQRRTGPKRRFDAVDSKGRHPQSRKSDVPISVLRMLPDKPCFTGRSPCPATSCSVLVSSIDHRVDLGDIAARKSHHSCIPIVGFVGVDKDRCDGCLSFGEGLREISDLVSGYLSSIWIRQM